ncbi:MAG: hypothetical protein ACU83N_14115 [Gammaproteobacteria bacterium]
MSDYPIKHDAFRSDGEVFPNRPLSGSQPFFDSKGKSPAQWSFGRLAADRQASVMSREWS